MSQNPRDSHAAEWTHEARALLEKNIAKWSPVGGFEYHFTDGFISTVVVRNSQCDRETLSRLMRSIPTLREIVPSRDMSEEDQRRFQRLLESVLETEYANLELGALNIVVHNPKVMESFYLRLFRNGDNSLEETREIDRRLRAGRYSDRQVDFLRAMIPYFDRGHFSGASGHFARSALEAGILTCSLCHCVGGRPSRLQRILPNVRAQAQQRYCE